MATPFLGEIKLVAWKVLPPDWALCNGAILPINSNQQLFSLIGSNYGGDGRITFALPNLQGRVPLHGNGATGGTDGVAQYQIAIEEVPQHTHQFLAASNDGDTPNVVAGQWLAASETMYVPVSPKPADMTTLHGSTISSGGGNMPHENRQPYLALNYVIAMKGIMPSQS